MSIGLARLFIGHEPAAGIHTGIDWPGPKNRSIYGQGVNLWQAVLLIGLPHDLERSCYHRETCLRERGGRLRRIAFLNGIQTGPRMLQELLIQRPAGCCPQTGAKSRIGEVVRVSEPGTLDEDVEGPSQPQCGRARQSQLQRAVQASVHEGTSQA
ncbi:hypothetical protein SAM23877_7336 [Streptomyces ambofaciens ATCC 23877]|uniref:Uncharacterized protein n=1 Tax=Streptomyces ambofaciens (strain ATCC 23877 / 3486 / DSM 40053 / JCM 4204 / NBRC 12836 / NRRL B-2516) TaxID=278992 RepID=A0A0K2B5Q3_STRA7|nr:hypothetical protein SAM23877_7336 [Streptomyces ambofaciens ATCC 23877]